MPYLKRPNIRINKSKRAGLILPVSRFANKLRKDFRVKRLSQIAPVYITAAIEYLVAEIIELSGNCCHDNKRKRITPRDINLSIMNDEELYKGGVLPDPIKPQNYKPFKISKQLKQPVAKAAATNLFTLNPYALPIPPQPKSNKKTLKSGITTLTQRTLASGQILHVLQADITDIEADAIVSHYNLGGMVGSAIANRGGPAMQIILNNNRGNINSLPECGAGITDASQSLLCKHIIHLNSPSWNMSAQTEKINQLTKAVENIIVVANKNKIKSLAIPNLCSAGNGYPKQVAAQTILRAINNHFKNNEKPKSKDKSSIEKISFVLYDMESVNVYTSELAKLEI